MDQIEQFHNTLNTNIGNKEKRGRPSNGTGRRLKKSKFYEN